MDDLLERKNVIENEVIVDEKSICTTCIHTGHCMYQRQNGGVINSCDEFEPMMTISRKNEILPKDRIESIERKYKGLCANCENRNTCMFADSVSGIWHCEEYR